MLGLPDQERRPEVEERRRQIALIVQSQAEHDEELAPATKKFIPRERRRRRNCGNKFEAKRSLQRVLSVACLATVLIILRASHQLATCSMCQHHQAMLQEALAAGARSGALETSQQQQQQQASNQVPGHNLIVCPKSSQFNDLPQFPSRYLSPTLERQQRQIMKHLNASFANHLQRRSFGALSAGALLDSASEQAINSPTSAAEQRDSSLIDDELLNEIISPLVVDAAYERAKELIVKRRKLENELVRQGEFSSTQLSSALNLTSQVRSESNADN